MEVNVNTEYTVEETQQRILNRINEALDNISIDGTGLEQDDDKNGPPKDIRAARLINELALSYRYLQLSETKAR